MTAPHQGRADGLRTPVAVLGWVQGRGLESAQVQRAVRHLAWHRQVNQQGYVSVQRFYIYAERGLARQRVAVWVYEDRLAIEYQQTQLARYRVAWRRKKRQLSQVTEPQLYRTAYASPQLEFWELDEQQWQKVRERAAQQRVRRRPAAQQLPLWPLALLLI